MREGGRVLAVAYDAMLEKCDGLVLCGMFLHDCGCGRVCAVKCGSHRKFRISDLFFYVQVFVFCMIPSRNKFFFFQAMA